MKHLIIGLTKFTILATLVVSLYACGGAEERKEKYLEKGKTYFEEKNYDKAKIEFKNVLQIDPKFADAYFYMGQLEEKNKELRKSLGNYQKAIELDPKHTLAKIKLAKIYVIAGTEEYIKKANNLLGQVKQEQPDNSEAELISATIKFKDGDKAQAMSDIEKVVKKDVQLVEGIRLLASIYTTKGEEAKAVKLLTKGAKDNPDNIPLRVNLAKLLAKNKDYSAAEKYLKQAISIEPEKYSLQVALSSFYATSGQDDKAESVLRSAIEQDDEDAKRYLMLIEMLASKISIQKAEEELKQAITDKPDLYELKFAQVNFYVKTGKRDEAKLVLKQVIEDKSYGVEGVKARNLLSKYLLEDGDLKGAKGYADEVLKEHPNNNDALLIISKLALVDLDAITAINGLRTVVKNDPKSAEASLLLAQAYELNKESSLAENELKKAIESNPINDQVHVNYARYLGSKGRIEEVVDVVDKALTYFEDSYDLMNIKLKVLASQGKESELISLLNVMEQVNVDKAEVNLIKGKYHLSKRELDLAIEQFEKAYDKSHDKYKPLELITNAYIANQQSEKALERLQMNVEKNPNDAAAILLIGKVYFSQKKIPEAREKFKQASEAAESWLTPYMSLAASYMLDKNVEMTLAVYNDALTKLKNKIPVQLQIASIYERQKEFDKAMDIYKEILAESSTNKLAANNYASLLLDHGGEIDYVKALDMSKAFEKANQPALQDTLAWAYAKTGDNAKAIEILKPIVEKSPKIAVFRYHLGYALFHMGDKAAAKSHLEIASSSEQTFTGKDKAIELLKSI